MLHDQNVTASFNEVQGITSTDVPAYSNAYDDFISFEPSYICGVFTGFKWQCVEFARRWLLLRKSCIFQSFPAAANMWTEMTSVERVTDGRTFAVKTHPNGSPTKPKCDTFLIYPRTDETPFGHIALICEVQEDFVRVAEENYRFHFWPGQYSRQIPMVRRDGLYYIEDYYNVFGWMEIENDEQLQPLCQTDVNSILPKYRQVKPMGKMKRCLCSDWNSRTCFIQTNNQRTPYYKIDENFLLDIGSTSNELYRLFMLATDKIIHNDGLLMDFGIPKQFWCKIRRSWMDERKYDPIDHLDFKFDGNQLVLCSNRVRRGLTVLGSAFDQEMKAPTMNVDFDQTSCFQLHRLLVRNWKKLNINATIHILNDDNRQEIDGILYMTKILTEAGLDSKVCLFPDDFVWKNSVIVDKDDKAVEIVWKAWDWETIFADHDGYISKENESKSMDSIHPCLSDILLNDRIRVIEPFWKSIPKHNLFLPVLYSMFPCHLGTLLNGWNSTKDSKRRPWMYEQCNEDLIFSHAREKFQKEDKRDRHFDHNFVSEKHCETSDKILVSWIINDLFSGLTIYDDQSFHSNTNHPRAYCCVI